MAANSRRQGASPPPPPLPLPSARTHPQRPPSSPSPRLAQGPKGWQSRRGARTLARSAPRNEPRTKLRTTHEFPGPETPDWGPPAAPTHQKPSLHARGVGPRSPADRIFTAARDTGDLQGPEPQLPKKADERPLRRPPSPESTPFRPGRSGLQSGAGSEQIAPDFEPSKRSVRVVHEDCADGNDAKLRCG